jgi:hypothetical protein
MNHDKATRTGTRARRAPAVAATTAAAILAAAALGAVAATGTATAEEMSFVALMNGANEVPPVVTPATGVAQAVLDTETLRLRFEVQLFDLANFRMMHIHLGAAGTEGPLIYLLSRDATTTYAAGEVAFNQIDLPDLLAGNLYVNAHTAAWPDGEIRGQLLPGTLRGRTVGLSQSLSPENVVPPVEGLDAAAGLEVTLDLRLLDDRVVGGAVVYDLDYRFPGSVVLTGLHVHRGEPGGDGPIVLNAGLAVTTDTDGRGRLALRSILSSAQALETVRDILRDPSAYYADLHTAAHPDGALRSQLRRAAPEGRGSCESARQQLADAPDRDGLRGPVLRGHGRRPE